MDSKVIIKCPNCNGSIEVSFSKESRAVDKHRDFKIAAHFISGYTYQEIGKEFNISRQRVNQILAKHGFTAADGGKKAQIRSREKIKKFCVRCKVNECKSKYCNVCRPIVRSEKHKVYNKNCRTRRKLVIADKVRDVLVDTLAAKE